MPDVLMKKKSLVFFINFGVRQISYRNCFGMNLKLDKLVLQINKELSVSNG